MSYRSGYPFVYVPNNPNTGTGSGSRQSKRETSVLPANGVVPVVYGRRKIPGLFVYLNVTGGYLHAVWILCEGIIQEIESIYVDGKDISNYSSEIYYETRLGSMTQSVCSLSVYDSNWNDALAGTAYIYMRIQQSNKIQSLPKVEAVVRGVKVYDPRSGSTAYSTNPALCLVDMLRNNKYGARIPYSRIDWDSVSAAANYCDELIGTAPNQEKRYEFNYVFDSPIKTEEAIGTIAKHFLGAVIFDGTYKIEYARPRSLAANFSESEIWNVELKRPDFHETFNRVIVTWTDPTDWETVEYSLEDPNVVVDDLEVREQSFSLEGCLKLSQASRIAHFLLNSTLNDLDIRFTTYNAKGLEPLDVFDVTHSIGLSVKQFQAVSVSPNPDGSWTIEGVEYDPAVFSDTVITEPTFPDTNLPHPSDTPTDVTSLTLTEILYQMKDSTWMSKIHATWTASTWPFLSHYEVWIKKGSGSFVLAGITSDTEFEYVGVEELVSYEVKIITVSTWDIKSNGVSDTITPQGKYLPPTWKTGASLTADEAGDIVFLKWAMSDNSPPAEDIDIIGYEIRRGFTTDSWDQARFVTFTDSLSLQDKTCPSGTWRYFIKAKDSVGNYTDTALTADVTVTLNPNLGFQQENDLELSGGTTNNTYISEVLNGTSFDTVVRPDKGLTWLQRFDGTDWTNGTYDSANYPIWNQPAPVDPTTMEYVSTQIDLGHVISGRWTLYYQATITGIGASLSPKLLLSSDGSSWTEHDASSVFSASARYAKVKMVFTSTSDKSFYTVSERVYVNIQADPKQERGSVTVGTTQPENITFSVAFIAIETVKLTVRGSSAKIAVYDNLDTSGFDLYLFDTNNNQTTGTVDWEVNGY